MADLINKATHWAIANGLVVVPPSVDSCDFQGKTPYLVTPAPFALYPTPFPRTQYDLAVNIQPLFNKLVHNIANNLEFLEEKAKKLSQVDPFTNNLYQIFLEIKKEENSQKYTLGFHRSDYLLHAPSDKMVKIQQVELNTISSSFGGLSGLTSELHRYIYKSTDGYYDRFSKKLNIDEVLPLNTPTSGLVKGISEAFKLYNNPEAIVLMIVQPNEHNIYDQKVIEHQLLILHKIQVIRKTLTEIGNEAVLSQDKQRRLYILAGSEPKEVAVAYFRSGYSPDDYISQLEWDARLSIERSHAIKCPDILYHLAGTKKVQQELADIELLKLFLSNDEAELVHSTFTGIYPLDSSEIGQASYREALSNPTKYVMKPSREGGGNNIYGEDIPLALSKLSEEERAAFILMDRIVPPTVFNNNVGIRQGVPSLNGNFISELGTYGVYLGLRGCDEPILNEYSGYLLRSKLDSTNEGGVAVGHAVIDSVYLV
ncbi:glutathione synthase [Conidiobolus coronatus NRRL 28638]|uniref:Glutathione synthetase n=1 Tax=Conidiobolus coronatus (strain ATCC 28846 / CBS 209.66 / NRRL 28638) TaxID=796925 RepID=A0A137PE97_CONC2|nr:glutathione synthase [Conidiobolus coronatus NRRL 28638]|eukprot:KXN73261.1 glutathione synthase [Conidiobolus coronatus NRRL 28638]